MILKVKSLDRHSFLAQTEGFALERHSMAVCPEILVLVLFGDVCCCCYLFVFYFQGTSAVIFPIRYFA